MDFKDKVVYQIWPRSFMDSNKDGIGDLRGIVNRLDYIQNLGVDLIWLSPIYASHNYDYGYDIDDYYSINPEFGTMEDFDYLLSETKKRGMNLIMDLVANHTSDSHEWFIKALSEPESEYKDYYVFKDGKNGKEPNNWLSCFGGSAWQKDEKSGQYYLTLFTPHQCDLNWENEKVRQGIYEVMRFWLDKGIAGFRMDVINTISKKEGYPDKNPQKKGLQFADDYIINRERSHDFIQEMHDQVLSQYDAVFIGEGMMMNREAAALYSGKERNELNMMFHFDLALLGCGPLGKYDFRKFYRFSVKDLKQVIMNWQTDMQDKGYWLGNYLSNHDQPRQLARFGDEKEWRNESAKALGMLNILLKGTPFIYQGEELGMTNCKLETEEWRDYEAINDYEVLQKMMHLPASFAKKIIQKMTRDHARTPMQWSTELNAGFSEGEPWIKVNPNYRMINANAQEGNDDSILSFYKQLIQFRKNHPALYTGTIEFLLEDHGSVMAFRTFDDQEEILVMVNLTKKKVSVPCPLEYSEFQPALFTAHPHHPAAVLKFEPYEGMVFVRGNDNES